MSQNWLSLILLLISVASGFYSWNANDIYSTIAFIMCCITGIGGLILFALAVGHQEGKAESAKTSTKQIDDQWTSRKEHAEAFLTQCAKETNNFQKWIDFDSAPDKVLNNEHTHTTPFEQLRDTLEPLVTDKEYGQKAKSALDMCNEVLSVPDRLIGGIKSTREKVYLLHVQLAALETTIKNSLKI